MPVKKPQISVIKQNIGVDISKDDFKACFYHLEASGRKVIKGTRTFKNTLARFKAFLKWIEKKRIKNLEVHITLEATGVYYENLTHFLHSNDYFVSVVLPNQSKAYAQSLNLKTKTDKVDAKMLGQLGIERNLFRWKPTSNQIRKLKQLTRDRANLLEEKTALSNKLHALAHSFEADKGVIKRAKQRLNLLKKQIKQVEKDILTTVQADDVLQKKIDNICKIKGLGMVTVATIIAETNGFELFTSRSQLISYAGYDVVQKQSGTSINGKTRISKKGNSHIRRAMYFPAICMVKHEPAFKQLFERVLERSGIKMKGYVAVQRKALILIYALFKNDEVYNPNYQQNKQKENVKESSKKVDRIQILPTLDARSKATSFVA
ncbi:MAG: IS110 family transposase [Chitinophagales bacterium]